MAQANSSCLEISNIPLSYDQQTDQLTRLLRMFGTYTQYKTKIAPALGTLFCYVEYD